MEISGSHTLEMANTNFSGVITNYDDDIVEVPGKFGASFENPMYDEVVRIINVVLFVVIKLDPFFPGACSPARNSHPFKIMPKFVRLFQLSVLLFSHSNME